MQSRTGEGIPPACFERRPMPDYEAIERRGQNFVETTQGDSVVEPHRPRATATSQW